MYVFRVCLLYPIHVPGERGMQNKRRIRKSKVRKQMNGTETIRDTGDRFVQSSLSIQIILDLHDLSETALAEVRNIAELRSEPRLTRSHGQKGHGGLLLSLELEILNCNVGKTRSCNSALKLIN